MSNKIELRIAFPLDDDFEALSDAAVKLVGQQSNSAGGGQGMREMCWVFDEYVTAAFYDSLIQNRFPGWKVNIREATTNEQ